MKKKVIDGLLNYRKAMSESKGAKEKPEIYDYIDYGIIHGMKREESKEIDEIFDEIADKQIYEIMEIYFDGYGQKAFRETSDRWERKFPKILNYIEKRLHRNQFVKYMNSYGGENYFDIGFLVENFENAKKYANVSTLCAQRMYETTKEEKYLEFANTLALRKLFGHIILQTGRILKKTDRKAALSDVIYKAVEKHLPDRKVLAIDMKTFEVKEEYTTIENVYKTMRLKLEDVFGRKFSDIYNADYGFELKDDCPSPNNIESDFIQLVNSIGREYSIFNKQVKKVENKSYAPVRVKNEAKDYMSMNEGELLRELVFNFETTRYAYRKIDERQNHLASFMFEMAKEKRLGQVMKKFESFFILYDQYEICSGSHNRGIMHILAESHKYFDYEKEKFVLPKSYDTGSIYHMFLSMEHANTGSCAKAENDGVLIDYLENIENLIQYSQCHDSIYLWVMENHMDRLYDFIKESDTGYLYHMFDVVRNDESKIGYLMANKTKDFKKMVKKAIYELENLLAALEIEAIDKAHKKTLDEMKTEYEMLVDEGVQSNLNDIAKKEIKAAGLKKYSWLDLDSLSLKLGETKLTKQAVAYLFKMIENGIIEELPTIYDNLLSKISSENPLEDYNNLIMSYKDNGFKPVHRYILYFCKVLLDENTLYKLVEDTKDEKISKSIAVTYLDIYRFKGNGSELELLIKLSSASKNKEVVKLAKKQIRYIRTESKMNALDFNMIELSINSFARNDKLEFDHSSGVLEAGIGKKNKLEIFLDGEPVKRLPSARTDQDGIIKDRINLLKKEIKKVEDKYASYLKNLFNFNIKLSPDQLKWLITYPVADKFIHSLFFKSKGVVFTIDESKDLVDINYDEVQLSSDDMVEFVSNLELSNDELEAIKEYMDDNKLSNEIGQFELKDMEIRKKYDLKEQEINFMSASSKLEDIGFVLSQESFELEFEDGLEIILHTYLGSVSDTYNMTLESIEIEGDFTNVEKASRIKRLMNCMMEIGIDIHK